MCTWHHDHRIEQLAGLLTVLTVQQTLLVAKFNLFQAFVCQHRGCNVGQSVHF